VRADEIGPALPGRPAGEVAMIGDDVEADIAGAMAIGLAGLLVRTGNTQPATN
jgi:ribonucleotide monophosphatase NagD (HAD superfamily)